LDAARRRELERLVTERTAELEEEKHKSDELLLNILPAEMAQELKEKGAAKARRHECVTVFFSDFKDFSKIAENMEPEELVAEVDYLFRAFDEIIEQNGLEKIKTIGDAYMCVGGIATDCDEQPVKVIRAALEIQAFMKAVEMERSINGRPHFQARIGIHTGPVVAGVVGIKKFAYDIWGDTVNIAARMEETSEIGRVNVSASTYQLIKDHFECTYRGKITSKNKGEIDMYFVDIMKPKHVNSV
jgi:class 3 adenylate cyclase